MFYSKSPTKVVVLTAHYCEWRLAVWCGGPEAQLEAWRGQDEGRLELEAAYKHDDD